MATANKILTIVETPGRSKFRTEVDLGVNIGQLVAGLNLFGRQIIADGRPIDVTEYEDTIIDDFQEIWAVGATKGATQSV